MNWLRIDSIRDLFEERNGPLLFIISGDFLTSTIFMNFLTKAVKLVSK
jgi:hypothetical protein